MSGLILVLMLNVCDLAVILVSWWLLGGYCLLSSGYCLLLGGYWWLLLITSGYCSFPLIPSGSQFKYEQIEFDRGITKLRNWSC